MMYSFRPRPIGGELFIILANDALEITGGMKVIRILYADITRVQLVYRPTSLLQPRYMLLVRDKKGARLKISNATYRGLAEIMIQDESFRPFLAEFYQKLPPNITPLQGETTFRFSIACVASACIGVITALALFKMFSEQHFKGVIALGIVATYLFTVIYKYLNLNRPRH